MSAYIFFAYLLGFVAIAISLWRCEPFVIDTVAVLANILALMVTILLGIIAYNYFIQKQEVEKFKSEIREEMSKNEFDIYINLMNSFGASRSSSNLFPLGVTLLGKLKDGDDKHLTLICSVLSSSYANLTAEEKANPVILTSIDQLKKLLCKFSSNIAATQLKNSLQ